MAFITGKDDEVAPGMAVLDASNTQKPGVGSKMPTSQAVSPTVAAKRTALEGMGTKKLPKQKFVYGGVVKEKDKEEGMKQLSTGIASGASKSYTANSPQSKKGSGSFTNLKAYVDANKGKTKAMGSTISGGIKDEAASLSKDIAGKRESSLGAGSDIAKESARLKGAGDVIKSTVAAAGSGKGQAKDWSNIYSGKTDIDAAKSAPNLYQQGKAARDLSKRAGDLSSARGIASELAKTVGKQSPQYTGGQRSLDSFLLSGKRGAEAVDYKGVKKATAGLGTQAESLEADIRSKLSQQGLQRKDVSRQAAEAVSGRQEEISGDINNQITGAKIIQQRLLDKAARGGRFGQQELEMMGVSREDAASLLNDNQYFGKKAPLIGKNITGNTVRTAEQAAQINALNALAGRTDQGLTGGSQDLVSGGKNYASDILQTRKDYAAATKELNSEIARVDAGAKNAYREAFNRIYADRVNLRGMSPEAAAAEADKKAKEYDTVFRQNNNWNSTINKKNIINSQFNYQESKNPTIDQFPGGVLPSKLFSSRVK